MELPNTTRRTALKTIGATIGLSAIATPASAQRESLVGELLDVWAATYTYNDPARAYADGYVVPGPDGVLPLADVTDKGHAVCGMGYHFVNREHMGTVEATKPQVLTYGVDEAGELDLGGVEWVVPKQGPHETEPPDLFDHDQGTEVWQEDSPQEGLWSMHAWIHAQNPDGGFFEPFNPQEEFHPDGCMDPREEHDH